MCVVRVSMRVCGVRVYEVVRAPIEILHAAAINYISCLHVLVLLVVVQRRKLHAR